MNIKKYFRYIAGLTALSLAAGCSLASAALYDGYDVDTEAEKIEISGNVNTSYRSQINLLLSDSEGAKITMTQFNTGKDGKYSLKIDMSGCDTGWYNLKVYSGSNKAEERLLYYTKNSRAGLAQELALKEGSVAVREFMDIKNPESIPAVMFEATGEEFELVSEDAFSSILYNSIKDKATLTAEEAVSFVKKAAILGCLSEGKLSPADYGEMLGLSEIVVERYESLTDDEIKILNEKHMTGKTLLTENDVADAVTGGVIFALLERATSFEDMNGFILDYAEITDADISGYSSLKQSQKLELCEAVSEESFTDSTKIGEFIDKKIKDIKRKAQASASTGGGGGGGGGGRGASVVPTPVNTEEDKVETLDEIASLKVFDDLEGYEWALDAISVLKESGIINGMTENTFCPGNYVKREELVKMLVEIAEKQGVIREQDDAEFDDVPEDSWYYKYVMKACGNGIANGTGNRIFGSGAYVTREDAAVLIYRTALLCDKKFAVAEKCEFSDENKISDYAINSVQTLADGGIINGIGNGLFAPKDFCNRAQVSKMIYLCFAKDLK